MAGLTEDDRRKALIRFARERRHRERELAKSD